MSNCAVPLYLMDNVKNAGDCGMANGTWIAIILIIVVVGISLYIYFTRNTNIFLHVIISLLVIWAIWYFIPSMMKSSYEANWRGYQAQINAYVKTGFTKTQAINNIQKMKNARLQADATRYGAHDIASAIRFGKYY